MFYPKKIAVLVHNDVMRDARVRKQARSLVEAGYAVDVFGYSVEENTYPNVIEGGANLKIETVAQQSLLIKLLSRARKKMLSVTRVILTGRNAQKARILLWILGLSGTFLAILLLLVFSFPWMFFPLTALLVFLFVGCLFLWLKRQFLDDWVRINWAYKAVAHALARNVIEGEYDTVHCHDVIALLAGEMIKKKKPDIRLIWDAHELYTELAYKTPYMSGLTHNLIERVSRLVDRMITISPSFVDFYAQKFPGLPKAVVVMNATRRPVSTDLDRSLLRAAACISDRQKVILFQGGLSPNRGVEVLLEAAQDLPESWSVVFMGFGPLEKMVESVAKTVNLSCPVGDPRIAIIPPAPQEQLRNWTSGADLGIIPYENTSSNQLYCTPNKLWEYPNARVPVLASDLIEMGKIIRAHGIGKLLPRDFTAADIVAAIDGISEGQLAEWRRNCDVFNDNENWEKFEQNLLEAHA